MFAEKKTKNMPEEFFGMEEHRIGWLCPFFWRKEVTL
jgi:hypothetical protein